MFQVQHFISTICYNFQQKHILDIFQFCIFSWAKTNQHTKWVWYWSNRDEPCHEIMVLFVLRKLILQARMCSHPMGLDVWFLVGPFIYFILPYVMCANSQGSGETAQMCRLSWAFAGRRACPGRLCDKYHNVMSWLKWLWMKWHRGNTFTAKPLKKINISVPGMFNDLFIIYLYFII